MVHAIDAYIILMAPRFHSDINRSLTLLILSTIIQELTHDATTLAVHQLDAVVFQLL
jgi:protein required for attachment to host cells